MQCRRVDRSLCKPELVPVDPESIVQLAAIFGAASRTHVDVRLKWIERQQRSVFRATPTFARQQRFLRGEIQRTRFDQLEIGRQRVDEWAKRPRRDESPLVQTRARYKK